jgi:PAS domain S-box-containing protein
VNRVIRNGRAVMMLDTSQEDEENLSDSILKSKIKSIMCVPLISKSKTRGVIYVHSVKEPYGFRKDDLFLLTGLSYPAAVTLENSLLYSKRKQAEEALQEAHDVLEERVEKRTAELSTTNALLRESEEKYRNLFDNIRDFIYTHDLNGRFLTVNRAAAQTLGYTPENLIGRPISDFMLSEHRQAFDKEYLTQIKKEGSLDGVTKYLARDSSQHYIEYRSVLVDQEGKEPYVSGIGRNITDRILSQREVQKLEQQLQHAQKMEAIGTLAGGIAHDFNNLLMGILGNTSLMILDMDDNNPQYERLKTIERHVQLGADLTEQLLGFARGGKYEVKTTDVNQLVRDSSEMFGRAKKEITIHLKYQEDLWPVELDRRQIEHVFLNLYVNAWQAMTGAGDLYIETDNITLDNHYVKPYKVKPGRYVKISLTDTGVGMDKVTQRRIFEPFFTTKEMGRGTGLGLASAYGIVKNHGGYINVYSEKDKGTTFKIYLPASEKEISEKKGLSEMVIKGTGTLLLVDDEDIVIGVGEPMLKTLGYEALVARSGREAIQIYKENQDRIDMVILDMIMSDMTGGETYDRLKEINPRIKVLLSSGYSVEGQATEILNRGCNGFIQKPFNMSELSKKIGEILAKEQN